MAIRSSIQSIDYQTLIKNTSIADRVSLASTRSGQALMASLSPTELAAAFPDYYRRASPDVSGFISAQTKKNEGKVAAAPSTTASTASRPSDNTPAALNRITDDNRKSTGSIGSGTQKQIIQKAFADELRRRGVPEKNIPYAVAALSGQVQQESRFNPTAEHDPDKSGRPTGYGIYGARDPKPGVGRRTDMLNWLESNGYDKSSPEGQARYMVIEAFSGKFPRTAAALMSANKDNLGEVTSHLVNEFERPAERVNNIKIRTQHSYNEIQNSYTAVSEVVNLGKPGVPEAPGQMSDIMPGQSSPGLVSPVSGTFVGGGGSRYGAERSQGRRIHSGVDWQAKNGSSVHAMTGGTVLYNGNNSGYGANIVIKHDDGVIRRYATHGSASGEVGRRVEKGQVIGTIGQGHLHYEEIPQSLNGQRNPIYDQMVNNPGTFVATSNQRGTRDPSSSLGLKPGSSVAGGTMIGAPVTAVPGSDVVPIQDRIQQARGQAEQSVFVGGDSIGVGVAQAAGANRVAQESKMFTSSDMLSQIQKVPKGATFQIYAGTNDAAAGIVDPEKYQQQMERLTAYAKENNIKLSIHGPHRSAKDWDQKHGDTVDKLMAEAAAKYGVSYRSNRDLSATARDGVHFGDRGYADLAARNGTQVSQPQLTNAQEYIQQTRQRATYEQQPIYEQQQIQQPPFNVDVPPALAAVGQAMQFMQNIGTMLGAIPAMADGGAIEGVEDPSKITAMPMKSGRDDTLLMNNGEPVAKVNSDEKMTYDSQRNRVTVTPRDRANADDLATKMEERQQEVRDATVLGQPQLAPTKPIEEVTPYTRDRDFVDPVVPTDAALNDSMRRVMSRNSFKEEGGHFSFGASNFST